MSRFRQRRLEVEKNRLETLNEKCDHVRVEAIDNRVDQIPERYKVVFSCRGIIGKDPDSNPIFGTRHEVEIYCDESFPADVPRLSWRTPIWHPNIESLRECA